jgi:MFS family permease
MSRIARLVPHAVVFASSLAVMVLELVASRLVAKYLGSSLFTWTGVIGIVLGGISLGNWLGGRMADRFPPRRLAPLLLLAASLLSILVIVLDIVVGRMTWMLGSEGMTVAALARTIALIAVLFLLPSCAMGTISPVMAKYALEPGHGVGRTVGGIYAAGSLGSIGGTFLAGFLLIPALGLTTNIMLVGILLASLAVLMGGPRLLSGAWAALLIALALTGAPQALARSVTEPPDGKRHVRYEKDSPYSYLRVTDTDVEAGVERTLRLDALIHNRLDPARPSTLLYEYERIFEAITRTRVEGLARAAAPSDAMPADAAVPFSTLTLGGGGFTLPTFLERAYPDARHVVVEIDPDVVRTAREWFGLPARSGIEIAVADARSWVDAASRGDRGNGGDRRAPRRFDIVYCDVFNAFSVPAHLTTREFTQRVAAILAPDGLYLVNCIDILDSGRFLDAVLATLEAVFPRVVLYTAPSLDPKQRTTFVIAAGGTVSELPTLSGPDGAIVGALVPESERAALRARCGGTVLTDDRAPVDNLMAPVFLRA